MDYLTSLQEQKKWRQEKENIQLRQLIIFKSECFQPSSWAIGRIYELLHTKDGLNLIVVETSTNKLKLNYN